METVELTALPNTRGQISYRVAKTGRVMFELKLDAKALYKKVAKYLGKEKNEFWIPVSSKTDDYKIYTGVPIENKTFFELALCELKQRFGVEVTWTGGFSADEKAEIIGGA